MFLKKLRKNNKNFYQRKKYTNPFFQKSKKRKRHYASDSRILKISKFFLLGLFFFIGLTAWFVFYSNYFSIKEIEVRGGGRINPESIKEAAWKQINDSYLAVIPQRNIFIFNKDKFKNTLENKYVFNNLLIVKKIPDKIIVEFNEKKYALILKEGDRYYYCGDRAEVISEIDNVIEVSQKDYPVIENLIERTKIKQEQISCILKIFQVFKDYEKEFKINKFIIDEELNTVKVELLNGPKIFFSTGEKIEKQINKVITIKNEKLKESFFVKEYIDVRIGDSIYYR
ncbi:hypothetical protein KAU09_04630 [Candidatus Parcubacteria bacterium]|nr:hypothetical protein [Candidatus Parcubacteria bacterium]